MASQSSGGGGSAAMEALSIGTVAMVVLCILAGAICAAHVLIFHIRAAKQQHQRRYTFLQKQQLRNFDSPWMVRMALLALLVLWSAGDLLRQPWLRRGLREATQAAMCEAHVVWTLGLTEPALLLAIHFLLRETLEEEAEEEGRRSGRGGRGRRVMRRVAVACLAPLTLQVAGAAASHHWDAATMGGGVESRRPRYHRLVDYMLRSSYVAEAEEVLILCAYPLFSVLSLALFSSAFLAFFSVLAARLVRGVINRTLRHRLFFLLSAVLLLLPLHLAFLAAASSGLRHRTRPAAAFEVLMLLGFLSLLGCVGAAVCVLVVLPVRDACSAVCGRRRRLGQKGEEEEAELARHSIHGWIGRAN